MFVDVLRLTTPTDVLKAVVERARISQGTNAVVKLGRAINAEGEEFYYIVVGKRNAALPAMPPGLLHEWSGKLTSVKKLLRSLKTAKLPVDNVFVIDGKVRVLMDRRLTDQEKKTLNSTVKKIL